MPRYHGKMTTLNARGDAMSAGAITELNAAAKANPEQIIPDETIKNLSMAEYKAMSGELYAKGILNFTAIDKINLKRLVWRRNQLLRQGEK